MISRFRILILIENIVSHSIKITTKRILKIILIAQLFMKQTMFTMFRVKNEAIVFLNKNYH